MWWSVVSCGTFDEKYDKGVMPKVYFIILFVDWIFLDWIPIVLSFFHARNKLSTRVFRIRGFYVGENLLDKNFIENKKLVKMIKKTKIEK